MAIATPTTNTQAVATTQPGSNPLFPAGNANTSQNTNPAYLPNATPDNSNAKTTPIVGAGQAIDHLGTVTSNVNNIANGVANQSATNAANSQNQAQNSTQTGDNPQSGTTTQNGTNQGTNAQNPPADNSDLTGALNNATAALNAGNGITPPDQSALNTEESQLNTEASQINDSLTKVNSDLDSSYTNFNNNIASIQNGTFPLNAAQQGLVDQTKSAMQSLVQSAQTQAQLYAQAAQTFGAVHGLSEFNPGAVLQGVNAAVAKGVAAIADAEFKGTQALAQVQKDIQTEDMTSMTDSYDALTKELDNKQTELNKMASDVQTEAKNAQDEFDKQMTTYNTQVQNAVRNALSALTITDTEAHNLATVAVAKGTLDEKTANDAIVQRQNNSRIAIEQENATTARDHLKLDAANAASATSDASKAALNATVNTPTGNSYVNGDSLDSKAEAQALDNHQVVLKGDNVKKMNFVTDTETQLAGVFSSLVSSGLIDKNGVPQTVSGLWGKSMPVSSYNNGSAKNSIQQFNDGLANTITELKKIPGTGDLVSSLSGTHLDWNASPKDFMSSFHTALSGLQSAEGNLLTTGNPPKSMILNGKTLNIQPDGTYN